MNIIVDSRERTGAGGPHSLGDVVRSLEEVGFDNVIVSQLAAGDFVLPSLFGLVGVARESAETGAFYGEFRSGQVNEELHKLLAAYDLAILLLERWPSPREDVRDGQIFHRGYPTGVTVQEIDNWLQSRQEDGIRLRISSGEAATPANLLGLAAWLQRTNHSDVRRRSPLVSGSQFHTRPSGHDRLVYIMQGFPGVGVKLAENVMGHFSGLPLAWTCTLEELMEIPLVGKKRAQNIWEVLK